MSGQAASCSNARPGLAAGPRHHALGATGAGGRILLPGGRAYGCTVHGMQGSKLRIARRISIPVKSSRPSKLLQQRRIHHGFLWRNPARRTDRAAGHQVDRVTIW